MYHNSGDLSDREGYDFKQLLAIARVQVKRFVAIVIQSHELLLIKSFVPSSRPSCIQLDLNFRKGATEYRDYSSKGILNYI